MSATSVPVEAMLTIGDVSSMLKVSERTVRAWIASGRFLEPDRPGGRTIRWRRADVDAWLASHAADKGAGE